MHRFQTSQGKSYRVYVGGQLVEFNDGVAVVDDATATKLRADPLCDREYFEVKPEELEAAKAVTTDPVADAKAKAEADDKSKNGKKNGK